MSVIAIKQHLMQVKRTSLTHLCLFFNRDADFLRSLLSHWIRKGKVRQGKKQPHCASHCFQCPVTDTEMYEWVA